MSSSKKKPSLYARKLLDKLRTLHPNASLESRQTLANWMVFNRKKAEGMAEGIVLAISSGGSTLQQEEQEDSSPRLMLLLRVLHQVFMEGKDDSDQFEKSAQLRSILADVALTPLFQALANSTTSASEQQQRELYHTEVKEMIDSWKEFSVFDGPTVWEGYKKAWGRAVVDAANATKKPDDDVGDSTTNDSIAAASLPAGESSTNNDAPMDDVVMGGQSSTLVVEGAASSSSATKDDSDTKSSAQKSETNQEEDDASKKEATATNPTEPLPVDNNNNNKTEEPNTNQNQDDPKPLSKRDSMTSVTSIDIDFDAEGVEEADVEPAKFLEASKVIASLQIARGTYLFL